MPFLTRWGSMTDSILLCNAKIWSYPPDLVDSLLIQDGKITAAGSRADLKLFSQSGIKEINLSGNTIWPGLCDFHLHLENLANQLSAVDCETDSLQECLDRLAQRAQITPPGTWIIGYGWNHNAWHPAEYGSAEDLDSVTTQHPVLLHAKSLHASWVNTTALHQAGIHQDSPDPKNGVILRDDNGNPTGVLLENATLLVEKQLPKSSVEETASKILHAQKHLHSLGITAVHDFDRWQAAEALLLLAERGELKLRVSKNLPCEDLDRVLAEDWRQKLHNPPMLTPGWIKAFADGALGPQSAAMLEPYEDSQQTGMLLLSAQDVAELGIKAARSAWPLSIHAIGDRAVREVIDGFEILREHESKHHLPHPPHRIEHVQIIHPDDLLRMSALGIAASVQPIHAPSDMYTADHHWGKRCQFAYAYKSMLENNLEVRFGSDAPVESVNPFFGIHAAVTRRRQDGQPGPKGWYPEQRVALEKTLLSYMQPFPPSQQPRLSPGSPADLIVLSQDPFEVDPQELWQLKPLMTMLGGEIVF